MKKLLFVLCMILLSYAGFSQEVSSKELVLWNNAMYMQKLYVSFKTIKLDGVETRDTTVTFFARNQKYLALSQTFMVNSCSKKEFAKFVEDVRNFYYDKKDVIENNMNEKKYLDIDKEFSVSVLKQYGVLGIEIKRGEDYHSFRCGQLMKIFDKYMDWYNKSKNK